MYRLFFRHLAHPHRHVVHDLERDLVPFFQTGFAEQLGRESNGERIPP